MVNIEKGMGRQFAREWYNTNRALLIAERQRKMDAQRTPVDHYMEKVFHCADPAVVDDRTGRKVRTTLNDKFMMKAPPPLVDQAEEEEEAEEKVEEASEQREPAPTPAEPVTTTIPLPVVGETKSKTIFTSPAVETKSKTMIFTTPVLASSSPSLEEDESELDMAMDFFHDMGGCMYVTTMAATTAATKAVATRVS
jgi:hypothetical protein